MAAYLIAELKVHDDEEFGKYKEQVAPMVEKYGGRYLVRGGAIFGLEGDSAPERMVVIEFPSMEKAREFYDSEEYQPVMELRLNSADSRLLLAEGL